MTQKRSKSGPQNANISSKFEGRNGQAVVIENLRRQPLIGARSGIAESFYEKGTLKHYKSGETITEQGDQDNTIYFLLCGSVQILVNGYEVAKRYQGTHVGEMAVIDPTARRSASIVCLEAVTVLFIDHLEFNRLAKAKASVWPAMSSDLANRLRERTASIPIRNQVPNVFIGSSSEGKSQAEAIRDACKKKLKKKVEVHLWSDGVFKASSIVIEELMCMSQKCDFAIMVMTPDDTTKTRGKTHTAPRDNVIYELGLFTGALGRERTLLVVPNSVDIKIPTDLLGVTTIRYNVRKTQAAIEREMAIKVEQIIARIKEHGTK